MKMISSIKIYRLAKSVTLIKSVTHKVNKVSSQFKNTKHTKIHTKNKAITIFLVTLVYFHLLLVT